MTSMSPEPYPPKKTVLPGVALGFAIASLCLGCFWPVGLVLSIIAMVKTGNPEHADRRGLAIGALVVSLLGFFFIGIQAAIAIPNFIRFQARSKQSECKYNLKAIFTQGRSRMLDGQPLDSFESLGFQPEPGNRYAYVLATPESVISVDPRFPSIDPAEIEAVLDNAGVKPGVQGACPDCTLTAACVGNVDNDDTLDVWSISTVGRTAANNETIEPGVPYNHVNDVQE